MLCGPLAVEDHLLSALDVEFAAGCSDPALLARPVVVVVPSASLRSHIAARVVERANKAVAGLSIVTLSTLAERIMQSAAEQLPPGAVLMPLIVRDLARAEPVLFAGLDSLIDGYGAALASVSDLLDAGMEAVHAEGIDERLAELASQGTPCAIARAVVRLAGSVASTLEQRNLGSRSHALRRAAQLLEEDPSRLVARAVFVHGFSDATGRASDLIAALLRFHAARVLIDEPPEPATGEPQGAFASHFRRRIESWGRVSVRESESRGGVAPRCIAAPGAEAEVRAVAARIAVLMRDGASPEDIAIVVRDVEAYATPLRIQLARFGLPFSGLAPVAVGGALAHKLAALVAILRGKERCPADRWLDAVAGLRGVPLARTVRADLRLALRHLGAARLGEIPALAVQHRKSLRGPRGGVALPARRGLGREPDSAAPSEASPREDASPGSDSESAASAETASEGFGAARRWLSGEWLFAACAAARGALARLDAVAADAAAGSDASNASSASSASNRPNESNESFACHARRIRALVSRDLGWPRDAPESEALFAALDALAGDAPAVEVPFDDFALLLARHLSEVSHEALGGAGGGVQVLSVMEARARTFAHLFVLGLNRDVFPRGIREDPLLGDSLRSRLAEMLPDIPIKQRGYDEERHLFAQLLASSANVTLSWQSVGDDGKDRAPSTLVERLRWAQPDLQVERAAAFRSDAVPAVPTPAHEHALRAALYAERDSLAGALALAFEERAATAAKIAGRSDASDRARAPAPSNPVRSTSPARSPSARELAAIRLAVIREFDAPPSSKLLLGPYFGFVGPSVEARDPRFDKPYVTALEQLARCPWKSFLERILRIEPLPDPIEALPEVDALMLGSVVHRVLERMVREVLPQSAEDLTELCDGGASAVPLVWPGDPEVFGMLREEAARLLAEQGMALVGLVEVLVGQAWPRLECARDLEWPTPDSQVVVAAAELEGYVQLAAVSRGDAWDPPANPANPVDPADTADAADAAGSLPLFERTLAPVQTAGWVGAAEAIYFRADRVDRVDGRLVLTDYKTGRPLSDAVRPATRRKHFEAAVRRGDQLQAVAYALAVPGQHAVGRYLYLVPAAPGAPRTDAEAQKLTYRAEADDAPLRAAFEHSARALLAARREGSFAPRLVEPAGSREPALCSRCEVAEACLRGDSGARRRLAEWAKSEAPASEVRAARALRAVWDLEGSAPESAS